EHGAPEAFHHPGPGLVGVFPVEEEHVLHGQVDEVEAADYLEDEEFDQICGKDQRDDPEQEGPGDPVGSRP
ncbi:MAG: hypothetical protein WBJ51_07540, partial [Methanoculleus sp.]